LPELDAGIFKSYDIRGTYPDQLNESLARLLGRALPQVFGGRRVVIGHDARLSSPALCASLAAGLRDAGAAVSSIGLCPTELVYYATSTGDRFDLGVMITASHNPPQYNGFKVVRRGGEPVWAMGGLPELREAMTQMPAAPGGREELPLRSVPAEEEYIDFALDLVGRPPVLDLRIAVDAGNGVGALLWERLARRLGCETIPLNFEPDGRFPAHHPDTTRRENLQDVIRATEEHHAALGLAFDGDADRVVAVLEDGHVVDGSEVIATVAARLRQRDPGLVFAVGQTTSRKCTEYFRALGAEPPMVPVGHAKIKAAMRAVPEMTFAGEDAGHYYYRDFFCSDSALITTLHLLHLAPNGGLARFVGSLPGPWHRPFHEPFFRFDDQDRALAVCRQAALTMLDQEPEATEITCEREGRVDRRCARADIECSDGVRVDYADWWLCVRPSGTEPIARLAVEARSPGLVEQHVASLSAMFKRLA
jgi:phosphomannomutase